MFVVVTNTGTEPLEIHRIHASAPFQSSDASLRLEPGASQMLGVSFLPKAAGRAEGKLEFRSQRGKVSVALSGEGEGQGLPPAIDLKPASLRFGPVQVEGRMTASLTIENRGGSDLRVTSVRAGAPFETSHDEQVIAPGSRADLLVHFAPQKVGRFETTLVLRSNDPRVRELVIPLQGVGSENAVRPAIAVSSHSLDFGAVPMGSEGRAYLEIFNDGRDPLAIAGISLPKPFRASNRGRWIEPGRSFSLPVLFSPSKEGDLSDFMEIRSNDPDVGLLSVALRGRGLPPSALGDRDAHGNGGFGSGTAAEAGTDGQPESMARTEALPDGSEEAWDGAPSPEDGAQEGSGSDDLEQAQDLSNARVLEGSEVMLGSYPRRFGDTNVGEFSVDASSGTVWLEGVEFPKVDAALSEFFTFSPTEGVGTIDSLGDIEIALPVQVSDRWGNAAEVEVLLTTATTTALVGTKLISMTGQPVGADGIAKLVGLAIFESGPLRKETMRIVLNVQVE